jgi:formylglycine-generating enzyme required for sulfatase activity
MFRFFILASSTAVLLISSAVAQDFNPRIVKAVDFSLKQEFEYLVFDLGKGVELKLVKIAAKGKTFTIGTTKEEQEKLIQNYFDGKKSGVLDNETSALVTLTDDYYIGQFEVYRVQFRRFVEEAKYVTDAEVLEGGYGFNEGTMKFEGRDKKYTWQNTGVSNAGEKHPVTNVSRNDARKFCEWLMKKSDGKIKLREVRLPGEAEWEYACRAGSTGRFCFGDDDERLAEFANIADASWHERFPNPTAIKAKDGHVFAAPVGQFKPNNFGTYDMHGNVWEWCDDFFGRYSALPKEGNARQTKNQGESRPVLRGGSWGLPPVACRCANRYLVGAGPSRYGAAGFRVVVVR